MSKISERIDRINEEIADACACAGRDTKDVKLVIVTKSADTEVIEEVVRLGYTNLAENRAQRLKKVAAHFTALAETGDEKWAQAANINWHMIGHLQRNKVQHVLPLSSLIHSVDTLRLAEEINEIAAVQDLCPEVLLQVNTSREPQKYGVPVGAATHLAEQIVTLSNLKLVGLMAMAPLTRKQDVIRSCFERARDLFLEIRGERLVGPEFTELSMGMSSDYRIAIEEGSTILRIGSAIFAR